MFKESLSEHRISYLTEQMCPLARSILLLGTRIFIPIQVYLNSLELEGHEAQNPQCVTVSDGEQDYSYFHPLEIDSCILPFETLTIQICLFKGSIFKMVPILKSTPKGTLQL